MNSRKIAVIKSSWTYFLATFILSWGLCGILIFSDMGNAPAFSLGLLILAMIAPGITGILFTYLTKTKAEIRDYWKRTIDVKRLSLIWLIIVIGLPFLLQILAGAIDGLTGGSGLRWGDSAAAFISDPTNQLLTLFIVSLVPFFEELGWRGYAQDLLQNKHSAVTASLIVGGIWSLWHLPASFIPNTYQAGLGIGTLEFWLHFSGIVFLSITISWVYINTNRSILVMMIFHATVNLSGEIIKLSETGETIYTFCWLSAAIAILFGFGKDMQVNPKKPRENRSPHGVILSLVLISLISAMAIFQPTPANAQVLKSRFLTELENIHHEHGFPGATAAYILPDGSVEVVATGLADKRHQIPMAPQSRMLAASIGKTFVAATVLALAQERRLDVEDPISKWLGDRPWFQRLANGDSITVRQLLTHTSGLANHVESEVFAWDFAGKWRSSDNPYLPEDLIAFILDQPALFPPGEGWSYSDTGYLLAGLIIEKVSGQSYYDEIEKRFLKPLQLTLTTPANQIELPNLATGYMGTDNIFELPSQTTIQPGVMAWHPGIEWTGGGLVSNPRDLVIWGDALFTGNAMAGDYLKSLFHSEAVSSESSDLRYGLAVAIRENERFGTTYGHGGWIPGYCSSLRYYPQYDVAIAFQINTDIGIIDSSTPVIEEIEIRLAKVVMASLHASRQE